MMKRFYNSLFFFFTISILVSCGKTEKKVKEISAEKLQSLQSAYVATNDSIAAAWKAMIQDDDDKLANMGYLLDEVAKTKSYDKTRLDSLKQQVSDLKALRYDQNTMADSRKIDAYDATAAAIRAKVVALAESNAEYSTNSLMQKLVQVINEADNRVLLHRVNYDNYAKGYNKFIKDNEKVMARIDSSASLQPKPLFELPQ